VFTPQSSHPKVLSFLLRTNIQKKIVPALLDVLAAKIPGTFHALMVNGVKMAGLGIRNSTKMVTCAHITSKRCTTYLVNILIQRTRFNIGSHHGR
jgi:hypothetical protein